MMDCPKVQSRSAPSTPSGSGVQKKSGATGKAKVPARIYAIDRSEVDSDVEVLEGTLTISGILAKVLIDPGSTHTFARPGFIKKLRSKTEILPYLIEVSTPT